MRSIAFILSITVSAAFCADSQVETKHPENVPPPVAVAPDTTATAPATTSEAAADPDACNEDFTGRNVTAEFRDRFAHIDKFCTEDRKEALKPYNVLIVHGLLGEVGLKFTGFLNVFSKDQNCIDYFKDQRKAVEEFGIEPQFPGFKSASVDRSGSKIVKAILESDKPVVIISHSKGGIDTLDALIKLQKKGQLSKVAGWISIQGCFYGSPDADKLENSKVRKQFVHVALKCLGANWDSLHDLTTTAAETYHADHKDEIATVLQTVPTLCFASWSEKKSITFKTDGPVPLRSAVLPNTDYIAKCGVTHEMTVIRSSDKYDRQTFTKALLTMLVDKLPKSGTPAAPETPVTPAPKEGGQAQESVPEAVPVSATFGD